MPNGNETETVTERPKLDPESRINAQQLPAAAAAATEAEAEAALGLSMRLSLFTIGSRESRAHF